MSANDGVHFSSPSSSFHQQEQPVTLFTNDCATSDATNDDQSATSSTLEASNKIKNKKRQPKYRVTKRPPSERRFQCDHCESRFFTQKDVKRHLVVHTGVRNFACPYCTQRFGRKDHLVRHAKKSHDQDTRSFKRRNRAQPLSASSSSSAEPKKTRKSTARSKRKPEENFAAVQPNTCTTASTATVTTTSLSTSYYLHDNGFSSANRVAATSNPNFSNSTLTPSSTSTSLNPFPKMTLVDHPTTSTSTASFSHRNYPSSFANFEPSSSNFQYNANGTFNQFLPEASGSPYSVQLAGASYLNYDYKPPSNTNYSSNSQHESFVNSSTDHLPNVASNSNSNISSFKSITSTIVDGFNTCIDLDYNNGAMNSFNAPLNAPFSDSGHPSRFHTPFN